MTPTAQAYVPTSIRRCLVVLVTLLSVLVCTVRGDACPPGDPNSFTPPLPQLRLGHQGYGTYQICSTIDLNGDGLPDYLCAYASDLVASACHRCVYLNNGSGWVLDSANPAPGAACYPDGPTAL